MTIASGFRLLLAGLILGATGSSITTAAELPEIEIPIADTLQRLLQQEDTDGDRRITFADDGAQRFLVRSISRKDYLVAGTYPLANLVQELALADRSGCNRARITIGDLYAPPPRRVSHMIQTHYWNMLTRRLDAERLEDILRDPKTEISGLRIYVPHSDPGALRHYRRIAQSFPEKAIDVFRLPETITPEYVKQLNERPGILTLAMDRTETGDRRAKPFVVPGGRFNEMYGWDSYFIALGLLADGRVELARAMVDHFVYQIDHYGKILNANRTYYLTRSQPPFLTSMALAVYADLPPDPANRRWLANVLRAAIREYEQVWMSDSHQTPTGLSRYYGHGLGIPPETEPSHYDLVLKPWADRYGLALSEFARKYQTGELDIPDLDTFFRHDRAMRESGHDTTYRLIGRAADLNTVALNSLLFKYEMDLATSIEHIFGGALPMPSGTVQTSGTWFNRAARRRQLVTDYLWSPDHGLFFDYNFVTGRRLEYVSATTLFPLWAGLATQRQALRVRDNALRFLECPGGLASSARNSRGPVSEDRPLRQWDYPFGWAPHQMIAWRGLSRYGLVEDARRLAWRWLYMIALLASRHNGMIVEKYDVVDRGLGPSITYGNVGHQFEYVPEGGFGWTNASFQVGLRMLSPRQRKALDRMIPPEWLLGPAATDADWAEWR